MAYLTISIEFANSKIAFGHIKDSRVSYTTRNAAFPKNFVLYPGRWVGSNGRGTFNAIPDVLIEDSIGELSIDSGIQYFSALDYKQFSFSIVDDGTYKFLTKNQNLSGRVLITYTTESELVGLDTEYPISILDLYSVVYDNGIVKFDCDTVSSWDDNSDNEVSIYGNITNKKLEKLDPENILLWPVPISLKDVYDGRFQNDNFAFNTNYKKTSSKLCRIRLDLKESFTPEYDLIKQYVDKFVKIECVDGKGVGKKYSGKLTRIILPLESTMYYALEFPFNLSSLPDVEELSSDNFVLVHDSSSNFKISSDYVVYSVGDISLSDIESLKFTNSDGLQISIPPSSVILENGKLKIPNDYELNYKAEIPLTLTDFTSTSQSTVANLYDGDFDFTNQISIDQANSIINDHNSNTFVGTLINNSYGIGSYCFFTFEIGNSESNLSLYKNASKYVLNGKVELEPTGSQNVQMAYKWLDIAGTNDPFEFNSSNVAISYPIKTFTASDTKWYTLNRYSINETYTGTISGGENYLKDKIELSLTEDSDEVKKLAIFFYVNANATSKVRLYDLNICSEFSYKFNSSSELFISLKNTHPGASISDISEIIAAEYGKKTEQPTVSPLLGSASGIITGSNSRKILQELISETPCSFSEKIDSNLINGDFYYFRFLKNYYTIASTNFDLIDLPLIEIKSVSVNDDWYNTVKITSGDAFYVVGKTDDPLVDTNTSWTIASNTHYNQKAEESFQNNGVIKSINKELKYITDLNSLLSISNDKTEAYWSFVKQYTCKCTAPINIDILYKIFSIFDNSAVIKISHPGLFDNAIVTMRINKMDINFQEQIVTFECDIFDIQYNPEDVDFTLWFDSPFQDYTDKIQDQLNNNNDDDWYVGIL